MCKPRGYIHSTRGIFHDIPQESITYVYSIDSQKFENSYFQSISLGTIPLIDVGFGIRASEINSSAIFTVMTETRDTINHRYGPGQVQYSVIIYGNKGATSFTFDTDSALDMNGLIAAANQSLDVPGPIDLPKALKEAEQLFQSHPTRRPSAKRVFIAITDTAVTDNDTELISAGDALRRQGILVFSVNNTGDGLNAVTITEIDFLGFPPVTTVRSVIIAETIIKKALEGNKEFLGIHDCY